MDLAALFVKSLVLYRSYRSYSSIPAITISQTTAAMIPAIMSSSIIPKPPATFLSAQPIGGGLIMSKKRNRIKVIMSAKIAIGWLISDQKLEK